MLVDVEIRERLNHFCKVTKQTQEKAANQALREMLERCDADPLMKERMDKAKALKEALANL
jgi:predicted transcriptional regulator